MKKRVMDNLAALRYQLENAGEESLVALVDGVIAALAPCTVLTAEEARALIDMAIEECITPDGSAALERALLSPDDAGDE